MAVGFATLRQGDAATDKFCNDTYETAITWECDVTKNWNSTSTNATSFVTSFSPGLDKCFVSSLPPVFNVRTLTIPEVCMTPVSQDLVNQIFIA